MGLYTLQEVTQATKSYKLQNYKVLFLTKISSHITRCLIFEVNFPKAKGMFGSLVSHISILISNFYISKL